MKARLTFNNSLQKLVSGLRIIGVFLTLISFSTMLSAQSANRLGTQAENKGGASWSSTYATDKIETVNLANGNLSINFPLVTIGGRGSAALTVSLSYNSKVWTGETQSELVDEGGVQWYRRHHNARYDNSYYYGHLGGGWKLSGAPFIKTQYVEIDHYSIGCSIQEAGCHKYALTKTWVTLPDGSEVELRDELTNGAPYLRPSESSGDRDRGRVWKSTDGSFITFVTDANNGVVTDQLSGWVFLGDGTRLRIEAGNPSYRSGACTQIIDRNGNILTIDYGVLNPGATTFVDQLGRQVILQGTNVTIKGYQGAADRTVSFQIDETLENLRSDYQSVQQPIVNGDYDVANDRHSILEPHTDLFGETASVWMMQSPGEAVKEITLLDGRKFQFRYNIYGEVAEIIYPGDGRSEIDYEAFGGNACEDGVVVAYLNRRVTERRLYGNGTNLESTWSYIYGTNWLNGTLYPTAQLKAFEGTTGGALLMDEKHFFLAIDAEYRYGCGTILTKGSGYQRWDNAREFRVEKQTGSGTQIVERVWAQRASVVFAPDPNSGVNAYTQEYGQEQPQNDPRITQEDIILEDGKMKRTVFQYDDFNNVTLTTEHDFGTAGNPGAVLRKTERTYLSNQNGYCYTNLNGLDATCGGGIPTNLGAVIHQKHLVLSQKVMDASNNQKTLTEYEYDQYTTDPNHAPIVTNSGMINYDGTRFGLFSSTYQPRGNATRIKSWVENSDYIYAHSQYDNAGNVIKTIDAKNNSSTISYTDNFGNGINPDSGISGAAGATFALPTLATNPLGWQAKSQYDFTLGAVTGTKDINGVISRIEYDIVGRAIRTTGAYGTTYAIIGEMTYPTATSNSATSSSQITETTWKATRFEYYGFDRPILSSTAEDGEHASQAVFTIFSKTIYDGIGRTKFQTNPYRSESSTTDGWTRLIYDLAGRVTEVATFSDSPTTTPPATGTNTNWTGSVSTSYNGVATTVTDQAGKLRRSIVNSLGQLSRVDEPDINGNLGTVSSPNQPTNYSYDLLNNLLQVQQIGTTSEQCGGTTSNCTQTRIFSYDGLSRLKSATNPEAGTINYIYDVNSNLTQKTDARGVQTNYVYDALNRPTNRNYSAPQNLPNYQATPNVTYTYDDVNIANSKGKLTKVSNGFSMTEYTEFDLIGRVKKSKQTTDGTAYNEMLYSYNLSGALIEETYPSGRVVKNTLSADGSLQQVQSRKANGTFKNYANSFNYTASGAISSMRLGNGKWENTSFNSRLQPTQIGLGTSATNQSLLKLNYDYGTSDNNGNVKSQTITVPNIGTSQGFTAVQTYLYDSLNRLNAATENIDSNQTASWKQAFSFDRYGNRRFDEANTTTLQTGCQTAVCNPQIDPTTNKLIGTQFDNSGNTKTDASNRTFIYDTENKQVQVSNVNGVVGNYFYDGDGKRVKKYVPSTQETTIFVYDASSKLVEEYSTIVESSTNSKIGYLTNDHLGSPRINTDANGAVTARHDNMPFGEEIQLGTGGRNSAQGYGGADSIRQKFTSYERDIESNLDFAQARMFGSGLGRFMSPDPYNPFLVLNGDDLDDSHVKISQFISQPQYWNRYTYSINNPLKFVDRDGEHPIVAIIVVVAVKVAVGAAVGAAAGAAIEAGKQIYRDGKITDSNAIKSASVDGAIFGAFIGGAGPIGAVIGAPVRTAIVAGGVGSVTGGIVRRNMEERETTTGDVITDAIAGGVGGGAGAALGRVTSPKYNYPNGLNSNLQRRVADETVYRTVNRTANRLFVPRSITNSLFDSQMGLRTMTYGSSFPATVARGTTKSTIKSTNKPKKCPQGPNQCTEVTVTVRDDE